MGKRRKLKSSKTPNTKIIFDKGKKFVTSNFVAFYLPSDKFSCTIIASKKVGNAVKRNRSKRRIRELIRLSLCESKFPGMDIIILARNTTPTTNFTALKRDFNYFVTKLDKN